jgi:hypothetical protein
VTFVTEAPTMPEYEERSSIAVLRVGLGVLVGSGIVVDIELVFRDASKDGLARFKAWLPLCTEDLRPYPVDLAVEMVVRGLEKKNGICYREEVKVNG